MWIRNTKDVFQKEGVQFDNLKEKKKHQFSSYLHVNFAAARVMFELATEASTLVVGRRKAWKNNELADLPKSA